MEIIVTAEKKKDILITLTAPIRELGKTEEGRQLKFNHQSHCGYHITDFVFTISHQDFAYYLHHSPSTSPFRFSIIKNNVSTSFEMTAILPEYINRLGTSHHFYYKSKRLLCHFDIRYSRYFSGGRDIRPHGPRTIYNNYGWSMSHPWRG